MKKILSLLIAFIMLSLAASAQKGKLFTGSDELSSSMVHSVYQDKMGFIWICTENGLNRYDGYNFYKYNVDQNLCSNNINCVQQYKNDNTLYIGTINGLCKMHNNRIQQVQYIDDSGNPIVLNAYITSLALSNDGTLYIATSGRGIWKINKQGYAERAYVKSEVQFSHRIAIDQSGTLWAVTYSKGVYAIKDNKYKYYSVKENTNHADITVDGKNNVYVGYINGGVYRLGQDRKQFQLISGTEDLSVSSLWVRKNNDLLIGTNGTGLKVFNSTTWQVNNYKLHSNEINMDRVKVYGIIEDQTGNLWLGLMQKGVFMQQPLSNNIHYIGRNLRNQNPIGEACVNAIFKHSDGTLWVASDQDGLRALDQNGNLIKHYVPPIKPTAGSIPSTILTMAEDHLGRLWIGSYTEGCGWFDPKTEKYHRYTFANNECNSVFDLRMGKDNNMWIGTLGDGVKCVNLTTGQINSYTTIGDPSNTLCNDFVMQMEIDSEKRFLFVGTTVGLSILNIDSRKWYNFNIDSLLPRTSIGALRYNKASGLWIGTDQGLYNMKFKGENLADYTITHYTKKNGLTDNHISAIEIDLKGVVWVSTSRGLCNLNPTNGQITNFNESDGIHQNEYHTSASCHVPHGMMYFGGTLGISFFYPKNVKNIKKRYNLTLTQMLVGGQPVNVGTKSGSYEICDTSLLRAKEFHFCHEDNTISLRFSTISYSGQNSIQFRYRINNDNWIMLPVGQNEMTLSRMQPGDYDFTIEAIENGSPSGSKTLRLVIHNPWYLTPIARIVYLLIFIGIAYWYISFLRMRNREKLKLQAHMHAEELNEQKLQSFINLSHEIRTPMTLILTPLLQLINDDKDSNRQSTYAIIRRNAERILNLVNHIMDIRKIDKGQMTMNMAPTNIIQLANDTTDMFRLQATNKQQNISCKHEGLKQLSVWIDPTQFDKVFINLLSNAIKYAPNGGDITTTITTSKTYTPPEADITQHADDTILQQCTEGFVTITIHNTGSKIPEDSIPHIFKRFYQAPTGNFDYKTGTGVGLDLTRSLVMLHHGSISASNTADGVEFTVTLPLGKKHLSAEETANWDNAQKEAEETKPELTMPDDTTLADNDIIQQNSATTTSRRATVVIVEDDDEIRNYLMAELSSHYRVLCFSNGAEALPVILREIPQLIISDVMMPGMDGHTLCSKIRVNVNTNHIPIIMITAKTRDEDKLQGLEIGADLYVTKPFNLDILKRSIANLIASRKLMENKYTGKEDNYVTNTEEQEGINVSPDELLFKRIIQVITKKLYDSDLNIDYICREVGISRVHLHRKMKEMTNQTPHDFIRNLRLKQAAKLLKKKGMNVTEVMYRCGFNSSTSFSTMFKRMYGMSPRDYKKEYEEDSAS